MADITNALNKFKTSVTGKDVRDGFVDTITLVNNDNIRIEGEYNQVITAAGQVGTAVAAAGTATAKASEAAASATSASTSAATATTKATAAAASATAAANSATAASSSASTATTKATAANSSAIAAAASAAEIESKINIAPTAAAASATAAANSATTASAAAVTATTKAGEAVGSADDAMDSQVVATAQAGIATTKAAEALASKTAAATSETNSKASETASKASETAAAGSAATATTKAGESAASAAAALASEQAAAEHESVALGYKDATIAAVGGATDLAEIIESRKGKVTLGEKISEIDSQLADIVVQREKYELWVTDPKFGAHSIFELGYETFDSASAFQAALAAVKLKGGGKVRFPAGSFIISSTLIVPYGVILEGSNINIWDKPSRLIPTTAGMTTIKFESISNGVSLKNFMIRPRSTDPAYLNCIGIDVNRSEMLTVENVTVQYCDVGFDLSGTLGNLYIVNMINISAQFNKSQGILVRSTGSWKNAIRIKVKEITDNNIGIECQTGTGNQIEGCPSELGRNTTAGIILSGGNWSLCGAMWLEDNGVGISVTGGNHSIDGQIYNINPISVTGGQLLGNAKQVTGGDVKYKAVSKKGLVLWESFDEGKNKRAYDTAKSIKMEYLGATPIWSQDGYFNTSVSSNVGEKFQIPPTFVDFTSDWTLMALGYGDNTKNLLYIRNAADNNSILIRFYAAGIQIYADAKYTNLESRPSENMTTNFGWGIIAYDSANKKIRSYASSGMMIMEADFDIASEYASPYLVYAIYDGVVVDELIMYNRILDANEINSITNLRSVPFSKTIKDTAPPIDGTFLVGEKIYNISPAAGGYEGWLCVESGSPGVWKGFGLIQS